MESEPGTDKKGFFGHLTPTRGAVLFILIIAFFVGIIASLNKSLFDMTKFTDFIEGFAYLYAPVVLGVAGGGIAKNAIQSRGGVAINNGTNTDVNGGGK